MREKKEPQMVCPKAKECKSNDGYGHCKLHKKNKYCGGETPPVILGCPACIPVEPEPDSRKVVEKPTEQMPLIVNPANPYPESVFPMQSWELVKAIPDEHLRTATSGCVARYVWNVCCEDWQKLIAEWIPAHDLAVRRAEWRRIFAHMHITRKQLLALPLDIRQDILKQQVDNYVQNLSDEEKLEELRKLD